MQNIEVTTLVWYYFFSPEIWPISVPPVARCRCKVKNDSESQNLFDWCYSLSELPNDSPQNNHNRIGLALEKIEVLNFFFDFREKFSSFCPEFYTNRVWWVVGGCPLHRPLGSETRITTGSMEGQRYVFFLLTLSQFSWKELEVISLNPISLDKRPFQLKEYINRWR